MPRALDPSATFKVVLEADLNKVPQPAFIYRYLTGAEQLEFAMMTDSIKEAKKAEGPGPLMDEIFRKAQLGLVGWEKMTDPATGKKIPFAASKLNAVVSMVEAQELIGQVFEISLKVPVDIKKKLGSQSPSATKKSARRARDRRSAKRNPQQQSL